MSEKEEKQCLYQGFLSKLPSFDPSWSDEVKIAWFKAFNYLRELFKTIQEQPHE